MVMRCLWGGEATTSCCPIDSGVTMDNGTLNPHFLKCIVLTLVQNMIFILIIRE